MVPWQKMVEKGFFPKGKFCFGTKLMFVDVQKEVLLMVIVDFVFEMWEVGGEAVGIFLGKV